MYINKIYRTGMLFLIFFLSFNLNAQVRIGGNDSPAKGATLDLNTTEGNGFKGALAPPVFALPDTVYIPETFTDFAGKSASERDVVIGLSGLLIYNTTVDANKGLAAGLYYWDGYRWNPFGCVDLSGRAFVCGDFVQDLDENRYKTNGYSSGCWMTENLMVFQDNTSVPFDIDDDYWYWDSNKEDGIWYSWEAAQKAAPAGWRLPTLNEWLTRSNEDMSDLTGPAQDYGNAGWMKEAFNLDLPEGDYYYFLFWYDGGGEYDAVLFIANYSSYSGLTTPIFQVDLTNYYTWSESSGDVVHPAYATVRCIKNNQ